MRFRHIIAAVLLICSPTPGISGRRTEALDTKKVAHITGIIDGASAAGFAVEMALTHAIPGDRLIVIDSGGGEVDAGKAMLRLIEREQEAGTRVVCLATHQASSMAFNILTHCDVRLATPRTTMVVHKVAIGGLLGPRLTSRKLREIARDLETADAPFRRDNAIAMHLSLRDYDLFADEETAWAAKTLLQMHYLNGIVPQ